MKDYQMYKVVKVETIKRTYYIVASSAEDAVHEINEWQSAYDARKEELIEDISTEVSEYV